MAISGKEPGTNVLDDTDLADDPIISAIQSLRLVVDDLQFNDVDDNTTNSGKTGITSDQASAITANTAKVGTETDLTRTEGKTVTLTVTESRGSYALVFTMAHGEVTKTATVTLR